MFTEPPISGAALWPIWRAIGDLQARVRAMERDHGRRSRKVIPRWVHYAAMGITAGSSLFGIVLPEKVIALLRLLGH